MKQYKMPKEAEVVYFGHQPSSHPTQSFSTQTDSSDPSAILHLFKLLPLDSQLQLFLVYFQFLFPQSSVFLCLMAIWSTVQMQWLI